MSLENIRNLATQIIADVDKMSRPPSQNLQKKGTMIPFYIYPNDPAWTALVNLKKQFPNTQIIAIINPESGPGAFRNLDYVNGIAMLHQAGIIVLGYVSTGVAPNKRSIANIKADVDKYRNWYVLEGIFYDEANMILELAAYYTQLCSFYQDYMYAGNPGTVVSLDWFDIFDIICVYENYNMPSPSVFANFAGKSASILPHTVSSQPSETAIRALFANVQYVYIAKDNKWNTLSSYTQQILAIAETLNSPIPIGPAPLPEIEQIVVTPDNYLQLLKNIANVKFTEITLPDGKKAVQVEGTEAGKYQVRLELSCTYENVKVSGRIKIIKKGTNQNYLLQEYGRGGHHTMNNQCLGSAMKGRFLGTVSTIVKEVEHPCYTGNRNTAQKAYVDILSRWALMETTIVNNPDNSVTVKTFMDGVQVGQAVDNGGWSTTSTEFKTNCDRRQFNKTGYRQRDEILNKAGTLVAWRCDGGTAFQFTELKAVKI